MSTRAIRTSTPQTACDVCGRTLLRGERAEIYLAGGDRHSVCELCTSRALHGGWVREGTVPDYGPAGDRSERRRSRLLTRRGRRRRPVSEDPDFATPPPFDTPLGAQGEFAADDPPPGPDGVDDAGAEPGTADFDALSAEDPAPAPEWPAAPPRSTARSRRRRASSLRPRVPRGSDARDGGGSGSGSAREPRHVRAVPTSVEHKIDAAVELFNGSEHPRTVAGITRSLGLPDASVHPTSPVGAIVNVVVAWELCWYRYEIDLSAEVPAVRDAGKGYELSELTPAEADHNAVADEHGRLAVG